MNKQGPNKLTFLIVKWLKTRHDGLNINVDYDSDDPFYSRYWDIIWVHDYGRIKIYKNNEILINPNVVIEGDVVGDAVVTRPEDPELFNKIAGVLKLSQKRI